MRRGQSEIFALIAVIAVLVAAGYWIAQVGTIEWMLAERDDLRQRLEHTEKRIAIKRAELAKGLDR